MMRRLALILAALRFAPPVHADGYRFDWPLDPRPPVVRTFDAPTPNGNRGHRGVGLASAPGRPLLAASAGTVVFAGELAGRPLVSIAHPGGLRTSYQPAQPSVQVGQLVTTGAVSRGTAGGPSGLRRAGMPALGRDVGSVLGGLVCRSAGPLGEHPHSPKPAGG